jgi:hypothetical protein
VLLILLIVLGVIAIYVSRPEVPADSQLIELFAQKSYIFSKIQQLVQDDLKKGKYYSSQCRTNNFGKDRCDEYNKLIAEIDNGKTVLFVDYDGTMSFNVAATGSQLAPGWSKGIIYIPEESPRDGIVLSKLDGLEDRKPDTYLRKIEPHWYLYYTRDVD